MQKNFRQSFTETRTNTAAKLAAHLDKQPHRSFRLSRRRDYVRPLELPGYWAFTSEVRRTLWSNRKVFIWLGAVYAVLTSVLVGVGSQDTYDILTTTLRDTSSQVFQGQWGEIGKAGLLFATLSTSGLTGTVSDVQQVYTAILLLFVWVTTVWLLRHILANRKAKLREALYSAGAPIIPTILLAGLLLIQLIPLAVATIGYSSAVSSGLLDGGVEAMLFWAVAGLLSILSIYWLIATFFAMVIVTLPGTYPMQALRTANEIVSGRRVKIILRLLWMCVGLAIAWAIILIPIIVLDGWIKSVFPAIAGAPIVPVSLLVVSTYSMLWSASYVYLLYRKVVEHDATK